MSNIPDILSDEIQNLYEIENNTFIIIQDDSENDFSETEIGDIKQTDFLPQAKFKKWSNEVNFSARFLHTEANTIVETDAEKIKWIGEKTEAIFYHLPEKQFEFEVIFKEKPDFNFVAFTIRSKGISFHYQDELTDDEIDRGFERDENVIGSYALYSEKRNGQKYKTGKVGHIFRPKAIDANGNEIWAEITIDSLGDEINSMMTIRVDETWLSNATYPVIVDPTFGYTSTGASNSNMGDYIGTSRFSVPEDCTVNAIYVAENFFGSEYAIAALYDDGTGENDTTVNVVTNGVTNSALVPNQSGINWVELTFPGTSPILSAGYTRIAIWGSAVNGGSAYFRYDSVSGYHMYDYPKTYDENFPDPITYTDDYTGYVWSVYADYTAYTVDPPSITSVSSDDEIYDGETGAEIVGTYFDAGTGTVEIATTATYPTGTVGSVPVIESYTSNSGYVVSSITLTKPSGVSTGDLLVMVVTSEDSSDSDQFDAVSGWTKLNESGDSIVDAHIGAYYRIADGTEGSSETITAQSSDDMTGYYLRISGVDTTDPINTSNFTTSGGSASSHTIPAVTTTVGNCLILFGLSFDGGDGGTASVSSPYTKTAEERYNTSSSSNQSVIGYQNLSSAGSSGNTSVSFSTSDGAAYFQIAIQPSSTPPDDSELVEQTVTSWSDTSIEFTVDLGNMVETTLYLYVTTDSGIQTDGFPITVSGGVVLPKLVVFGII